MKKNNLFICLLLFIGLVPVSAQTFSDLYNLSGSNGAYPGASLTLSLTGDSLFGMTTDGGPGGQGCIFSIKRDGTAYTDLLDFGGQSSPEGANPDGSLTLSSGGDTLYGMANKGGVNNVGCIFSIGTSGTGYTDLYDFNGGTSGNQPQGSLTLSITGDTLYGMTTYGGTSGVGNIFYIKKDGTGYTNLFSFAGGSGEEPNGSLTLSITGDTLFGMTSAGGVNNYGNVFCIQTNGSNFTDMVDFNVANGENPLCGLALSGSVLYGMTSSKSGGSYGTVFSIHTDGTQFNTLVTFNITDGDYGYGTPVISGNLLYGNTANGGTGGYGVVFSMKTDGTEFNDMFSFNNTDGSSPQSVMLIGNQLYGTTISGTGATQYGIIYSLSTLEAITTDSANVTCYGGDNGKAAVQWATGGTSPYTYLWSDGNSQTTATATGLSAGAYTLTVTDNTGISYTASPVTITQPPIVSATVAQTGSITCIGGSNGIATATATLGTTPYIYSWSNGSSVVSITNPTGAVLSAQTYTVTVQDSCGNSATAAVTMTQPNALSITAAQTAFTCNSGSTGIAMAYASGGTSPYTYSWSNGTTNVSTSNPTGEILSAGTYTVTVQDNCGDLAASATVAITSAISGTWLGGTSTDWNDPTNWCGGVPTSATNVIIPSGTIYPPTTNTGTSAICANLTVNTGATLTIPLSLTVSGNINDTGTINANANISLSGNWFNSGTFSPGTNTVTFNAASGTQTINEGGSSFYDVTFTGPGTLQVIGTRFGVIETLTNSNGGTLDLNGEGLTTGDLQSASAGAITNSNAITANIHIGSDGLADNFTGIIEDGTGTVSVTLSGGTLKLSSANPFSGGMNLQGGTLNISNAAAIGSGTFAISSGTFDNTSGAAMTLSTNNHQTWSGAFHFTGTNNLNLGTGTVAFSGTTQLYVTTSGSILTVGGVISGSSILEKLGTGTLTLTGVNTFTDELLLDQGKVYLNNARAVGTARLLIEPGTTIDNTSGSAITLNNNVQTWAGSFTFTGSNNLNMGTGAVTLNASITITTSTSGSILTEGGAITGSGRSITKAGAGTLTLSGVNAYTAGTVLSAGQLNINNARALGSSTASRLTIDNGTTIDNTSAGAITLSLAYLQTWAGSFTFVGTKNLNMSTGAVTLSGNPTITTTTGGSILTEGGVISGAHTITKVGAGTLTFTGNNTYTGATTINNGILSISADANLGTAPGSATAGQLTFGGGTLAATNTFTLNANRGIAINSSGGTIDVASTKTVTYAGTALGGALTSTNAGTLTFNGSPSITLSNLTINSTNTFVSSTGILSLSGNFTNNGTFTHNSGTVTFNGSSAQTMGGSTATPFNNLTINNTSGGVSLSQSETVNTALTLTSGQLTVGTNNLTMSSGATISGESTSSYVVTNGSGVLKETYNGAGTYLFPVGDPGTGDYTPISLGFTSGTSGGVVSVLVNNSKESHIAATSDYLNRFWTVSQSGLGTFSTTIQGSYLASDVVGTEADINTAQWTGASFTEFSAVDNVAHQINATVSSFGDFTGIPPVGLLTTGATATTNVSCDGSNNGSATASPYGGTTPYTYLWSDANSQTTITATGLSAGTYTVTVTDAVLSTATASVTITQPTALSVSANTIANVTCYGTNTGSLSATVSGGASPYTYSWTGGVGTNSSATGLSAGTYTVTVTDACVGDLATASVIITQPVALTVSANTTGNVSCINGANGTASATISGGTSPYTYSWNDANSQNTVIATGLLAGSYTLTVTDSCGGDLATASVIITQPATLIVSANATNISCINGTNGTASATISGGTSPYTYSWNDGNSQTTVTATGLSAGAYTVTVTDSCGGDLATASVTITQPATLVVFTNATNVSCTNGTNGTASATISGGTSPYAYSWNDGNSQTTVNATGLSAGTYTITVTDACVGDLATASVIITQPNALSLSANTTANINCYNGTTGTASSTVSGGTSPYVYSWNDGNSQTTINATGLSAGTYTITVTDVCAGDLATASVIITQPNVLSLSATTITNVTCHGTNTGMASSSVSGGTLPYTYSWTGGAGTNATATGLSAGSYTITVTDACGSDLATASVIITQPNVLSASANTTANVTCHGTNTGSASSTISGGTSPYTYSWTGGAGTDASATGLSAGTYTVTVTDACSGDLATTSVIITQPNVLSVSANTTANVTCYGTNTGSASSTISGGTTPYTYSWTDGAGTNATATGLSAGTYTVTVTDACGSDLATASVIITQPNTLSISANTTANINCYNGTTGSASSTVSGGTAPYTYSWTGGAGTNATATGLSAGTYTLTITDACAGDLATAAIIITQPNTLSVSANITANVTCYGTNTGSASSTISGGTAPYTYSWTGGAGTNATATGLSAGTYTLTITDACGGDFATASLIITQPIALSVSANTTANVTCYGTASGTASSTISGGTAPYTYSWTGGAGTNASATGLSAGTYTVTVTDACSGDIATASVNITEPMAIVITADSVGATSGCNGQAGVTIASGGTAPFTYNWSPGGGTNDTIAGKCAGNYCCIITDNNGCSQTTCITIVNNTSTGIERISNSSSINIYPNPTLGNFTITGVTQGQVIELYDYLGQRLNKTIVSNNNAMHFDISARANGIYLIRILNTNGALVAEKKMIKTE